MSAVHRGRHDVGGCSGVRALGSGRAAPVEGLVRENRVEVRVLVDAASEARSYTQTRH